MPQQTKTEALEELARLIRRDIMNGTARLNETWWFDNDTKMQDRIAHVLLDYSDEEKPEEIDKVCYNSRLDVFCGQIDELNEKCAALVVENKRLADDKTPTLRIDPDMSDPQPGKLLVVRVAEWDIHSLRLPSKGLSFFTTQFVGFLVETPAVGEQWCCVRDSKGWTPTLSTPDDSPIYSSTVEGAERFDTLKAAEERCAYLNAEESGKWRPVTVTQAEAIVGGAR